MATDHETSIPGERPGGIRAVSRAMSVLTAFSAERPSLPLADLIRHVGLPRTTVLRLVDALEIEGMVSLGADNVVRPGTALIRLAGFAELAWALPEAAAEHMRALAQATGETVSLYVRDQLVRVVIAQAPGSHSLRHVVRVGDRLPLHLGATAAALLAQEPSEKRREVLEELGGRGDEISPSLLEDIVRVEGQGWAISHGVREAGNSGLALALGGLDEALARPVALTLGGPTARFTPEAVESFVEQMRQAAPQIIDAGLPPALY